MRLILGCQQSRKRHPLSANEFWRQYFVEGCREAGIEVVEVPDVDWAEGLTYLPGADLRAWRARTWETTLAFARREHARQRVDLFLGYLCPQQIEPAAVSDLQGLGIPCVNYYCDNVREFRRVPKEFQPFALHWVPEFEALPMYQRAGLPHLNAPMPCWVPHDLRSVPAAETEPATFIGQADVLRCDLLGRALQAGADFVVRGRGWAEASAPGVRSSGPARGSGGARASGPAGVENPPRQPGDHRSSGNVLVNQWNLLRERGVAAVVRRLEDKLRPLRPPSIPAGRVGPFLSPEDYFRVSREAVVTIGVNRVPTAHTSDRNPLSYSRLRDLEAPMLGACYLTEWTAGLEHLYELGTEIESYRTPEELAARVDALKRDPARRRKLRERGQRRALTDHSVVHSLRRIIERLGIAS